MKRILCMVSVLLVAAMVQAQTGTSSQNPPASGQSTPPAAGQSMPSSGQSMPGMSSSDQSSSSSAEGQQLLGLEQQWAQSEKSGDSAGVARIESDNYVFTDPTGKVTGKQDDVNSLKSGQMKYQSFELSDLQPHVVGNTAVVTGRATIKGTSKGQDISGTYAFTATWVKNNGQWQAVATQVTPLGGTSSMPATSAPPPPQP